MTTVNITQARKDIYDLVRSVQSGESVTITAKDGNAVLISESDWNGIKETLYLLSIPGMLESIEEAKKEDISELETRDQIKRTL
ncbi:MAG: type II toxin-antitoxin system Phd/YefM family antitoxin [Candidatus Methanoplasma sp.]|jgi:prevent-host-death family protein|nr:type II toxin-antitoxin system Phd/YefM family antitoxin [Candidatus Methanoplasma sp.]